MSKPRPYPWRLASPLRPGASRATAVGRSPRRSTPIDPISPTSASTKCPSMSVGNGRARNTPGTGFGGSLLGVGQGHRDPAAVPRGVQQDAGAVGHLRVDVDRDDAFLSALARALPTALRTHRLVRLH